MRPGTFEPRSAWRLSKNGGDRTALVPTLLAALALAGCRAEVGRSALAREADAVHDVPAIGGETNGASGAPGLRRLWSGDDFNFYASSPSPDGRWVTEIDWTTGNLAVRDLATGDLHHLTDEGTWQEAPQYGEISIFSPDGRQVAYSWFHGGSYELRVLDFEVDETGTPRVSKPRVVLSNPDLMPYWLFGWSVDGQILATVYRPDETTALALISAAEGTVRILKSFDWREPRAALSSDGRLVAYDLPGSDDTPERDIHVIWTQDGTEAPVIEGSASDRVLAWLPEGGGLLFHSARSGTPSIWRLPFSGDRPSGPPQLVRGDVWRPQPLGVAGDALFFGVEVESPRFHTVEVDLEADRMLGVPTPHEDPYEGRIESWEWSRDGAHVIHDARRPGLSGGSGRSGMWLVLRSADGAFIRDFRFDLRRGGSLWAKDAETIFLTAFDDKVRLALRKIHLASGEVETVRPIEPQPLGMGGDFAVTPDGSEVYLRVRAGDQSEVVAPDGARGSIIARNLETGAERHVIGVHSQGQQSVSPDGTMLAFVDNDPSSGEPRILVVPVEGGPARGLFRAEGGQIEAPQWTPEGRALVFGVSRGTFPRGRSTLWKVDVDGGEPVRLEAFDDLNPRGVRLHPGGRRIAFLTGERRGEIWVLEDLPGSSEPTTGATGGSR